MLRRYIDGEKYSDCLVPNEALHDHLMAYKRNEVPLEIAEREIAASRERIDLMARKFCERDDIVFNSECNEFLNEILYKIMQSTLYNEVSD